MRYKVAPPARSLPFLDDARGAVPLVPDSEGDCCRAIQRATDVTDRETAREYLTFLQALDLVAEGERGYHRTRTDPDQSVLAAAFRENVFAAAELLDALEDGPLTSTDAFERVRDVVPRWERERHADWERVWTTRVEHLVGWAETFGLVSRTADGYERR